MSTEMITCPQCGSQMPANAQFCPECGKANAAYTPVSASAEADTPQGGTPTVNIGASADYGQYNPPAYEPAWEPGRYNSESAPTEGQPDLSAPSQPSVSAQPSQERPQYAPPPGPQYGAPTQNFSPYGTQAPPVQPYSNQPAPPMNYMHQQQVGVAGTMQRDPTVALLLELLGYIWFLGIGHIYGGRIGRGIALMIGYWCYWGVVLILALTVIGIPIACIMAIIWPIVPILSGLWIKNELEKENARVRQGYR